jgi:LPXTG-site transpeptidase (sortase) family protein
MKKVCIITIYTLVMAGGWWVGNNSKWSTKGIVKSVYTAYQEPTPTSSFPVLSNPETIIIPRLGISTHIEHVGLDTRKRMDVPKNDLNTAWYSLGAKPGEKGSAVIAGHFDTREGKPAVFYTLNTLQNGDVIDVLDSNGKKLTFVVAETKTVKDSEFPIEEVFTRSDRERLNLITCAGIFDQQNKNYEDRFVAFAVLQK